MTDLLDTMGHGFLKAFIFKDLLDQNVSLPALRNPGLIRATGGLLGFLRGTLETNNEALMMSNSKCQMFSHAMASK